MTTEIWRDFDPNLDLPIGLKNANVVETPQEGIVVDSPEDPAVFEFEEVFVDEDEEDLNEDFSNDTLDPPESLEIVDQNVRTGPDGRQVVDIIIEVEDVVGAQDYDIRITV